MRSQKNNLPAALRITASIMGRKSKGRNHSKNSSRCSTDTAPTQTLPAYATASWGSERNPSFVYKCQHHHMAFYFSCTKPKRTQTSFHVFQVPFCSTFGTRTTLFKTRFVPNLSKSYQHGPYRSPVPLPQQRELSFVSSC